MSEKSIEDYEKSPQDICKWCETTPDEFWICKKLSSRYYNLTGPHPCKKEHGHSCFEATEPAVKEEEEESPRCKWDQIEEIDGEIRYRCMNCFNWKGI